MAFSFHLEMKFSIDETFYLKMNQNLERATLILNQHPKHHQAFFYESQLIFGNKLKTHS